METVCKICGCALLDDQNIARDNFGVNLEVHADCLPRLTPATDGRAEALREAADDLYVVVCEEGHDCPEGPGGACCGQPSANPIAALAQAVGDLGDDLTYLPDAARFNLHLKAYSLARKLWAISARAAEREGGEHE